MLIFFRHSELSHHIEVVIKMFSAVISFIYLKKSVNSLNYFYA